MEDKQKGRLPPKDTTLNGREFLPSAQPAQRTRQPLGFWRGQTSISIQKKSKPKHTKQVSAAATVRGILISAMVQQRASRGQHSGNTRQKHRTNHYYKLLKKCSKRPAEWIKIILINSNKMVTNKREIDIYSPKSTQNADHGRSFPFFLKMYGTYTTFFRGRRSSTLTTATSHL